MKEDWKKAYQRWRDFPNLDDHLRRDLHALESDESLLMDCFYQYMEFGTGGIRGELGPGINRMNLYTVRKTAEGLARYLSVQGEQTKKAGVVIAFDSRHQSATFAREVAKVLGNHGIRIYLFERIMPTPILSFAVRHLAASAGVVITASHNPANYNGIKVYDADGAQITPDTASRLFTLIQEAGDELAIQTADEESLLQSGMLLRIGDTIVDAYFQQVSSIRQHSELSQSAKDAVNIVFTPLHGTTGEVISKGLTDFGYHHVLTVPEQALPDPDFSTVSSPNPEEPEAFHLALQYAIQAAADLVIGTDPDGDRLGVWVKQSGGTYLPLTGNQIGALLLYDVLRQKRTKGSLPPNGIVLKTIVTSELGRRIAADFGVKTEDTLTGFKYIGEKITAYKKSGDYVFLFGYEESFGYLIGDFVRDKDAVQSALLLVDLCAYHKAKNESLGDALQNLYERFGYYLEDLQTKTFKGVQGIQIMKELMSSLRRHLPPSFAGMRIIGIEDYLTGSMEDLAKGNRTPLSLPRSDVLKVLLEDGSWFCLRPSGTEPKLKLYLGTVGDSHKEASQKLEQLKVDVKKLLEHPSEG
ncbi:phospho-sugar mutase [Brevibacillus panacihumi]|uniref:Phosphoglucomutase n=1 Tax=Brevibacillus panacihumi TaxID=497735 RepID=A0A3M8DDI0_9BACL|nr:phospho-sugar mutase [Brevibacillus panacihumi]RNB86142.1 phospho-sugar mutase [Brevibacillus panacihumi]